MDRFRFLNGIQANIRTETPFEKWMSVIKTFLTNEELIVLGKVADSKQLEDDELGVFELMQELGYVTQKHGPEGQLEKNILTMAGEILLSVKVLPTLENVFDPKVFMVYSEFFHLKHNIDLHERLRNFFVTEKIFNGSVGKIRLVPGPEEEHTLIVSFVRPEYRKISTRVEARDSEGRLISLSEISFDYFGREVETKDLNGLLGCFSSARFEDDLRICFKNIL